MKPKFSVVVPLYNEEEILPETYRVLTAELSKGSTDFDYEIIFVNDGSQDKSAERLQTLYSNDPNHIVVVNFTRNFGQVPAMLAGFAQAEGDCVAVISADLQDPPSLLLEMFKKWKEGHRLVLGIRESRSDNFSDRISSRIAYKLMQKFVNAAIPEGGFDYFLMDKTLNDIVVKAEERNIYIQGHVLWPGIKPHYLPYTRVDRKKGQSHWPFSKKIKYLTDGFTAYSSFPIRLMSGIGLGVFSLGIIFLAGLILQRCFGNPGMPGSPIMIALFLLGGMQMMMTGIMGEYLWRNFDETRKRPVYLIDSILSSLSNRSKVSVDLSS